MVQDRDMKIDRTGNRAFSLTVTFERREDGGLRVFSDDVPGFVLSHSDADAVLADVKPTLEGILSSMLNGRVVASELVGLREALENAGLVSPEMPAELCEITKRYVAHFC